LLFLDDLPTEVDAFITDVDTARSCDKTLYLVLTFAAKRAPVCRAHIF
jgi:hypothetical protein